MNPLKKITLLIIFFFNIGFVNSQVILTEGFEGGAKPDGWIEQAVSGNEPWRYRNGGHSPNDNNWQVAPYLEDITRNPPSAAEGIYNAIFFKQGDNNERTKLITPQLNLLGGTAIEMSFYLCQRAWTFEGSTGWDVLRVYYKTSEAGPWVLLQEFLDEIYDWEKQTLTLPNPSETYYVAFEGHTRWGYGTCIDNIVIQETGEQQLYIGELEFHQPFSRYVPSGKKNVPLMRVDLKVFGNTGTATLDYINFKSLNTDDGNILSNSVKLYATTSRSFSTENPVGSTTSFITGIASFSTLNHNLPPGVSYLWLACDIDPSAEHENTLDVMVEADNIMVDDTLYPTINQSPVGDRIIYETLYFQDFEGTHNWSLTGEFEVASPSGLGGVPGNPDPEAAFSGTKILGTDLTGLGANAYQYEPGLNNAESYTATSPVLNTFYYTNLNIFFQRHHNIEVWDHSSIEVSIDGGGNWNPVWESNSYLNDFQWIEELVTVPDEYSRSENLRFRYKLGPTDGQNNYSGWNIDDIFFTGEFISNDAGISRWIYPQSGSGHSANDSVTVMIRNYGGSDITDPVPVAYSFNGGSNWVIDTLYRNIPVGDSVSFTFPTRVDLSQPGLRTAVLAKTLLPDDQYIDNDEITTQLYIVPTYLPPYQEDFEEGDGYWLSSGLHMWESGTPAGNTINSAWSGNNSWATGLSLKYGDIIAQKNRILFEDDFETDNGWTFSGEFERNIPSNMFLPYFAYSGYYCLGTDLSGMGPHQHSYENGITPVTAYTATSPPINVSDYSNINVSFAGWLMIQAGDSVKLEVSPDNGTTWITLWKNTEGEIMDIDYQFHEYPIDNSLSWATHMRFRFSLFYSSADGAVAEGWNIDDFLLTGDLIDNASAYLSSPSFNLTGLEEPVFEAKMWIESEKDTDGITLYYSLNDGVSWTPVTNASGFDAYWNWFTGNNVGALGKNGWSGLNSEWQSVRHILPASLKDEENVQLRFEFAADKFNNDYDGVALDDIQIFEAPHDAGIVEIIDPVTSCELSDREKFRLRFKNHGIREMMAGDTLKVGYYVERDGFLQTGEEEIVLSVNIPVGTTRDIIMNSEFDFSIPGDYITHVYTIENDPYFYHEVSNDTASVLITVNKPAVYLGPDISTVRPDTIVLDASDGNPLNTYQWQDGSIGSVFNVTEQGIYHVKVTNELNCMAFDTIQIERLIADVGVSEILALESACELGTQERIRINVENFGTDTLNTEDTIFVSVSINESYIFSDTLYLAGNFYPGEGKEFIFGELFDFSLQGAYRLKLYTRLTDDSRNLNDTLIFDLENYGYPDIELGQDTIVNAASYTITPAPGYFQYLWQDGSSDEFYTVDTPGTGEYSVIVSDIHGCTTEDAVMVTLNVTDISIDRILSPETSCNLSENIAVSARLKNAGNQVILSGEIVNLNCVVDGGSSIQEAIMLSDDLIQGDSIDVEFSELQNVQTGQWYTFTIHLEFAKDMVKSNDTIVMPVGVFEPPALNLGEDYQVITGFEHTIDAGEGFLSYEWQDGSTGQTYYIGEPGIGNYSVTVTDDNGCSAYDEVQVMLAVPDIGIAEVIHPVTSCDPGGSQNIELAIQNYGNMDISSSSTIMVAYSINGGVPVTENIVLSGSFENGTQVYHTFLTDEEIDQPGSFVIKAWTIYGQDLIPSNDTLDVRVDVFQKPVVNLSDGRDTLVVYEPFILAVDPGYLSYLWQDGSTGNSFEVSELGGALYYVTVTSIDGCVASDSVYVVFDMPDLAVNRIAGPVSACGFNKNTLISVEIVNNGYQKIEAGESLSMSYSVNGGSETLEVMNLTSALLPGQKRVLTFLTPYNFQETGVYTLEVIVNHNLDGNDSNNTMISDVHTWGYPVVDIGNGNDTLKTDLPLSLNAGSGFVSYQWQDNSSGSSLEAYSYGIYWVRVTDDHGCIGTDSVLIDFPVYNDFYLIDPQKIRVYPNPARDFLNVNIDLDEVHRIVLELFTIQNRLVYRRDLSRTSRVENEINIHDLDPGFYYLKVLVDGRPYPYTIVIE